MLIMDTLGSSQHSWVKTCHCRVDRGWNVAQKMKAMKNGSWKACDLIRYCENIYVWNLRLNTMEDWIKTHPGLFVHLALEVAEGPADFCHTFSFSVTAQRARFFLWYADAHKTLPLNKLNEIMAWPDHTHSKHIYLLPFSMDYIVSSCSWDLKLLLLRCKCCSDLTCMLLNRSCWRMTSYLKRSNREKTSAFRGR